MMSKDPENIWAVFEDHINPKDKQPYVYASSAPTKGKPYVSEALAKAMVAAAYEGAAGLVFSMTENDNVSGAIRDLTPTDAREALNTRDKRVREDALDSVLKEVEGYLPELGASEPQDGADSIIDQCWRDFRKVVATLIDRTAEGNTCHARQHKRRTNHD